jgi:hypothetical protein
MFRLGHFTILRPYLEEKKYEENDWIGGIDQ